MLYHLTILHRTELFNQSLNIFLVVAILTQVAIHTNVIGFHLVHPKMSFDLSILLLCFFTKALPTLLTEICVLSVDLISRLNRFSTTSRTKTNHVIFQYHYSGLERKYLICLPWIFLLGYLSRQIEFNILPWDLKLHKHTFFIYI